MFAQGVTIKAKSANTPGDAISCKGYTTAVFQVSGGLNGLVNFLGSVDGVEYDAIGGANCQNNPALTPFEYGATAPGLWRIDVTGLTFVRADLTNYVSGIVTVTINLTGAP
jgi:hypothetical protein